MGIIDTLANYMGLILGTLVATCVMGFAIVYYILKVRRIASDEERIDYSTFRREDVRSFVRFRDIIAGGNGSDRNAIGIMDMGNHVYVGGIDVKGYNYHSASAEERQRTMINMIAFNAIIEQPIQLRQTIRAIDKSRNIENEKECGKRIERELLELQADYEAAAQALDENVDNDEVYFSIEKRLKELLRSIRSKQWQLREIKEMIHYLEQVTVKSENKERMNQIFFTWRYNPDDEIEELSEAEIRKKAETELSTLAIMYGDALSNCGCSYKPLTADDLTDLLRRHYHPETGDKQRLDEILNSSYYSLYVTSDSLQELEREKQEEANFRNFMQQLEEENEERIREAKEKEEQEKRLLQAELQSA